VRGPRGAGRRQRTLAGSLDWSHALLTGTEKVILRRVAVFAGGFSLEAAQDACADDETPVSEVLTALGRLVDKSLVMVGEHQSRARYRMLETIRAYAFARLLDAKEHAILRDRHLEWSLRFVEAAEPDRERDGDRWRQTLLLEYDNLRAALDWGLAADDADAGRRIAASLAWLWHLDRRGREGIGYLRRAIDRAPADRSRLQARLLTGFALVADTADPLDVEYDAATRALGLATDVGDEGLRSLCLTLCAVGRFYTDFDAAWQLCEDAYAAAQAAGNTFALGGSRALQAIILHLRDQHTEAEKVADDTTRDRLRHHRGVLSTLLTYQAGGAAATGDPARGLDLARQAVRLAEPLGDFLRVGSARSTLARILALTGDLAGAAEAIEPVLRLTTAVDGEAFIPGLDQAMAVLSLRRGEYEAAIEWLGRAADSTDRGESTWIAVQVLPALGAATAAAGRYDDAMAILDTAVSLAQRRGMPGPLAEAYAVRADLAPEPPSAIELHHAALTIRVEHGLRGYQPGSLEALARWGAASQPTPDDVRILFAAEAARAAMNLPRSAHERRDCDATGARLREALGDATFDQAAAEGAGLPLGQAVDYARRGRGRRGRPATGWASLTPTELDVVRLVASGLTNPQIGAKLFMSRGTVKTHLSHILAKLSASNRTEIAAAAADRGLLDE
jgi:DNA-binding CsgD family transcriptional regulator/tetratricopeptide (TPR) repeat protein